MEVEKSALQERAELSWGPLFKAPALPSLTQVLQVVVGGTEKISSSRRHLHTSLTLKPVSDNGHDNEKDRATQDPTTLWHLDKSERRPPN